MRFDCRLVALAMFTALGGCTIFARSPWLPGDDPHGRDLKERAAPIVAALLHYRAETGHWPAHLFELEPKYLSSLPDGLNMEYQPDKARLAFSYQPSAPTPGMVTCATVIDAVAWDCYSYF